MFENLAMRAHAEVLPFGVLDGRGHDRRREASKLCHIHGQGGHLTRRPGHGHATHLRVVRVPRRCCAHWLLWHARTLATPAGRFAPRAPTNLGLVAPAYYSIPCARSPALPLPWMTELDPH